MKLKRLMVTVVVLAAPLSASAGLEDTYNTFYGSNAGAGNNGSTNKNTFVGASAGTATSTGQFNSFLGAGAGQSNTVGSSNTLIGSFAGYKQVSATQNVFVGESAGTSDQTGSGNVAIGYAAGFSSQGDRNIFLGHLAGYAETGSDKLYIDNCKAGAYCTSPFIYGELDTHRLRINGFTEVHADGVPKSQLNFSLTNNDTGGYLTSVLENNFFVSSGARYDGTAGGWIQRSSDGQAVIQGSGSVGYRIFTGSGHSVGSSFAPTLRLHIDYSGQVGINTAPVAGHEIHTSSGAYLAGGTWTNASSRALKDNIHDLSTDAAAKTLAALKPVTFNYKTDEQWQHVGFIAEDVPDLVASPDRKGLSPMDIVAVLTKVVQEQSSLLEEQKQELENKARAIDEQQAEAIRMKEQMHQLAADVQRLRTSVAQAAR